MGLWYEKWLGFFVGWNSLYSLNNGNKVNFLIDIGVRIVVIDLIVWIFMKRLFCNFMMIVIIGKV